MARCCITSIYIPSNVFVTCILVARVCMSVLLTRYIGGGLQALQQQHASATKELQHQVEAAESAAGKYLQFVREFCAKCVFVLRRGTPQEHFLCVCVHVCNVCIGAAAENCCRVDWWDFFPFSRVPLELLRFHSQSVELCCRFFGWRLLAERLFRIDNFLLS